MANYARFLKCALQVNPWTYNAQYQGKSHGLDEDAYNRAIADRCLKEGIAIVGIADHGSVAGVEKLRIALEAEGITVFPGFEVASTEKVHMVCLYAAGTTIESLNQYLGSLGISSGSSTNPCALSCLEIASKVDAQGGFWFAAHMTHSNGLLRLNQDGGGLQHIWCDHTKVLAAQIPGSRSGLEQKVRLIVENKNPDYKRERPIALLNAKDVRQPSDLEIPQASTWIKMSVPTLDGLRLACQDPESRVRLADEVNPAYYSQIDRITVRRGYLDDIELDLSPNLNALVGGRGTGKSTLIEGLRYALALEPTSKEVKRSHDAIVAANFAKEKARIELSVTSFSQHSERYIISRAYGSPPIVTDEAGNVLNLSPRDVLPNVEVYGQNELLALVQDDTAKARLLARFLPETLDQDDLLAVMKTLRQNREEINALEDKVAKLQSKLEQLPALRDRERAFEKLGLEAERKEIKDRQAARAIVVQNDATLADLADVASDFASALGEIELPELDINAKLLHEKDLQESIACVSRVRDELVKLATKAEGAVTLGREKLVAIKDGFEQKVRKEEHQFLKKIETLPALKGKSATQLTTEFSKVSGAIADLKPLGTQKQNAETKLVASIAARATLLARLAHARSQRWSALGKGVKNLNKRLEGQLKIEFEPERFREPLKDFLMKCGLEGVGDRRLAWIDQATDLSIADFIDTVRQGSAALHAKFKAAGLQKQTAEQIVGIPASKMRELEELELPERLDLLLNVTRNGSTFRDVSRLSTGQQCTAVLHLLLLDNRDPLILDQPEDNLDNAFIADHIVQELRVNKTKRQFLFATHNANIPVFGDAEWIGVLEEVDSKAHLKSSGSIDAAEVKDLAANILEGGREAFTRRREKYGL